MARRRFTATAVLVLCLALAGCGGGGGAATSAGSGGKVTLRFTWWGNADRAARTEQAVAAFEKANPDIDIQTSYSTYESYKQKLATQAAGGDVPDLIQLDYRQISQYAGSEILLDLGTRRKELPTEEMDAGLLKTGQVDGVQYALPMGSARRPWRMTKPPGGRPDWPRRSRAGPGTTGRTRCGG